jgi:superkiller protein 3
MPKYAAWLYLLLAAGPAAQADNAQAAGLLRQGKWAEALAVCDKELRAAPSDYRLWTLKGVALQGLHRTPEALASFRKAYSLNPGFVPALEGKARLEYQLRDPNCPQTLTRLLAVQPGNPSAHAMMAVLRFEQGDCAGALPHFAKARTLVADSPPARHQYAACLYQARQYAEAAEEFAALLQNGDDDAARFNLALALFQQRKFLEAAVQLQPLAARAVPHSAVLSLLADAYESAENTPEALEVLRRAIDLYPFEERHYIELAQLCLDHHSIPLGLEILASGRKNLPRSPRLAVMQGVLLARSAQTAEAEQAFLEAEAMAPDATVGRAGRGLLLLEMNMVDEAIQVLRPVAAARPQEPMPAVILAQALLRQEGEAPRQEAKRLLLGLGRAGEPMAQVRRLLGKIYLQENNLPRAATELEAALRLDPEDRSSAYQLITVYRKLGRMKQIPALQAKVKHLLESEREAESRAGRHQLVKVQEAPSLP